MLIYPHMRSLLPIILIVLALTGAITYALAKKTMPNKDLNRFGLSANQLESNIVPKFRIDTETTPTPKAPTATPTVTVKAIATPTITPTPTPTPSVSDTDGTKGREKVATKSGSKKIAVKTTVCTPVYGMANTCTEHVVVDTGAADSIFFNAAGLSYLGGLVAFIKARSMKK